MTRWVYVRAIVDEYPDANFYLSVAAGTAGSVPSREIGNREHLKRVFRRAALEKLIAGVDEAQARGEVFRSGPLEITQEQEDTLLGRN